MYETFFNRFFKNVFLEIYTTLGKNDVLQATPATVEFTNFAVGKEYVKNLVCYFF